MIPLSGVEIYNEIRHRNGWTDDYLPNAPGLPGFPEGAETVKKISIIQKALERFFSLAFGSWLEKWEMNRKIHRLSREQSVSRESSFSADVCKGHIDRHGENALTALAVRLKGATESQVST
jgi:hypothetical protein